MISRQLGDQLLILQARAVGAGGIDDSGIVFTINKDGTGSAVLRYFNRSSAETESCFAWRATIKGRRSLSG
jgi:hypothetical protein